MSDLFYTQFIPNSSCEQTGGVEKRLVEAAKVFYKSHTSISFERPSLELLEEVRSDYDSGAGLTLRCLVSRYIFDACKILMNKHGGQHQFKLSELVTYALDDAIDGDQVSGSKENVYRTNDRPLAIKVLNSFNPELKKSLKNWTVKLVYQYKEVNSFLLGHDLYLRSTWGILKDERLKSIAKSCNLSLFECVIVKHFQEVYKKSRIGLSGSICQAPDEDNLQEICVKLSNLDSSNLLKIFEEIKENTYQIITLEDCSKIRDRLLKLSPESLLAKLENIGNQVRKNKIGKIAAKTSDKFNAKQDIDSSYIEDFKKEIVNSAGIVVDHEYQRLLKRQGGKPDAYLEILHLYFCKKKKQEEIAVSLSIKQSKISRLLRKDNLYRDICYSILEFRKLSILPELGKDIDKLNEVKNNLMEFINKNKVMVDEAICQCVEPINKEVR